MSKRLIVYLMLASLVLALSSAAQDEKVDLEMISKIRYEGFRNSKIMETASGLLDGIGPRLTGSPNVKRANEWTRDKLTEFGLSNAHLEPWSPFGRGWVNEYTNVRMVSPDTATLIAYPRAWSPGTNGPVQAPVVRVIIGLATPQEMARDMAKYKGKLVGKIVLYGDDATVSLPVESLWQRYDQKSLAELDQYAIPSERNEQRARELRGRAPLLRQVSKFLADEGAIAMVEHSRGSIGGGTVFVDGGSYKPNQAVGLPQVIMATEQWNRIARLLQQKQEVQLELNIKNTFSDGMTQYNTIAEIPGIDKKDEIVMLGAHLDSWYAGTGATDNGAGSVVMMEAVRILKALGVKPRRTIRIALWTGEEQGLLGSQWYVAQHFGSRPPSTDPERKDDPSVLRRENGPMTIKPEQAKVSVYFNVDNGTGKIRGVYMQENAAVLPILEEWIKPFHDLGMDTLTMRNTGGTDHQSFDAVGIPGFQFIQDPMDYGTRTHHSNIDVYDRLQPDDLKQMAVIVASFVYNAAMREKMFPRKPIEKALTPPKDEQAASPATNAAAAEPPKPQER